MNKAAPIALVMIVAACAPDLTVKTSRVTDTRIVGLVSQPAEAKPNANVHWTAIVVSPDGVAPGGMTPDEPIDWNFCVVPRAPTDSATISTDCLAGPIEPTDGDVPDSGVIADAGLLADGGLPDAGTDAGPPLVPLAMTGQVSVASRIPSDACAKVGPEVPPAAADGSRQRPPDPDVTGGYYLPIRMTLGDDLAFGRQRLRCALPDVPGDTATAFAAQYHNNTNPVFQDVLIAGVAAPTDGSPIPVDYSMPIALTLDWTPDSIEDYVVVDPATRELDARTETFTVEWFTNGGELAHDRTVPVDFITSPNTLTIDADRIDSTRTCGGDSDCPPLAPPACNDDPQLCDCANHQCVCVRSQCAHRVTVWIVLKDDRGGVATRALLFEPL